MFRIALGHDLAHLSNVADASPEAPLETIAEPLAGVPGAGQVYGDALFSRVSLRLGYLLLLRAVRQQSVPGRESESKLWKTWSAWGGAKCERKVQSKPL